MLDQAGLSKEKKGACCVVIKLDNLCKQYGEQRVLDSFSMTVYDGEKLAIMGESGRGKTTLLRIIAGLEQPDSGLIEGFGTDEIAYVFQEPRLFDSLNVIRNLTVVSNLPRRESEKKAKELLDRVGLSEDAFKYPTELSGGMKQRVSLARAFMVDRPILLLDEPFSALDRDTKETMIQFVKEYAKNKTVILVTHDQNDALALCEKTECLD